MNREQRMDELLRQKLGGYQAEPSTGVWEGLSGRLPGFSTPSWRLWLNTLILPISVMILAGGIYLLPSANVPEADPQSITSIEDSRQEQNIEKSENSSEWNTGSVQSKDMISHPKPNTYTTDNSVESSAIENTPQEPSLTIESTTIHSSETKEPTIKDNPDIVKPETPQEQKLAVAAIVPGSKDKKPKNNDSKSNASPSLTQTTVHSPNNEFHTEKTASSISYSPDGRQGRDRFEIRNAPKLMTYSGPARKLESRRELEKTWQQTLGISHRQNIIRPLWSLGIFYIPEIYHSDEAHAEKTLYGFDGLMRYKWYNYTLEFGIGLGRVRNENLYTIDYNAFLGTYQDLDSIAFVVDSTNQNIVPQYYFSETSVYDSTTRSYLKRTVNKYTYLQFPFFIGYRYPLGRTSLTLRAGPMLSVLISSKEPDVYIDDVNDRIVKVNDRTPGRLQTNWQFLINAGISYQLSQKISLSMEPGIRFYLNPIYQNQATKPWSINLRTGIIYEF